MSDVGSRVKCLPLQDPTSDVRHLTSGLVVEEMPNGVYRVKLANGDSALAHAGGQKVRNFVRLLPGDRVEVALASHDLTRGRITKKL